MRSLMKHSTSTMQLRWQRSTPQMRFLAHRRGSPRGCRTSRNISQMCFNVSVLPIILQKSIMSMPLVAIYVQSEGSPKDCFRVSPITCQKSIQSFHTEDSTMNAVEVVQNNFNNWNRHDAEAIVAAFAEGGTYSNPTPFTGEAIGDFAKTVWTIFPDFSLDLISIGETGGVSLHSNGCTTAPTPAHSQTVLLPLVGA